MNSNKLFGKHVLANKILSKFIIIELVIYAAIILSLVGIFLPNMMNSTKKKCDDYVAITVNQLDGQLDNIDSYFFYAEQSQMLQSALGRYLTNQNRPDISSKLALQLNAFSASNSSMRAVIIDTAASEPVTSISGITSSDTAIFQSQDFQDLYNKGSNSWTALIYPHESNTGEVSYTLAYSKRLEKESCVYVMTILTDVTNYIQALEESGSSFFDEVELKDSFGHTLYATNFSENDYAPMKIDSSTRGYLSKAFGSNYRCSMIGYASIYKLMSNFFAYFATVMAIIVASFIFTIVVFPRLLRKDLAPIRTLKNSMQTIMDGDTSKRVEITSRDEIEELGTIYNSMLDTLENRTQVLFDSEKEKNQLRFSLIISQISPHFIFNTMNIITVLAHQKRFEDIVSINSALINLLRDRLRINDTDFTDTIQQEIDITKEYIKIMQFRTKMDVAFEWICEEGLEECTIPKNLLQPLIENSLLKGLYRPEDGLIRGKITTSFARKGNSIIIRVTDDGCGVSSEALERFYSHTENPDERGRHIGLSNIRSRLEMIYPEGNASINISNIEPHGACVEIKI